MQTVICGFKGCGFCSQSGFCLNRLVVINEQGVCKYLTKPGWDRVPEDFEKSTYIKSKEEQEQAKLLERGSPCEDTLSEGKDGKDQRNDG